MGNDDKSGQSPVIQTLTADEQNPNFSKDETISLVSNMYEDIVGTKCRAPFTHDWGEKTYGNALIAEIDAASDLQSPKVKIFIKNQNERVISLYAAEWLFACFRGTINTFFQSTSFGQSKF